MSDALPYYKRYSRAFLEGTAGLTLEVKGAYSIILDLIYMHENRLKDNPQSVSYTHLTLPTTPYV